MSAVDAPDYQRVAIYLAAGAVTATDAPDWQRVAETVAATGDTGDAPDWTRIIVGPGGTPLEPPTPPATACTLVQAAQSNWGLWSDSATATLSAAPTPGNELVIIAAVINPQDVFSPPTGFTDQGTLAQGNDEPGGNPVTARVFTRTVQSGDGQSVTWSSGYSTIYYNWGFLLIEVEHFGRLDFGGGGVVAASQVTVGGYDYAYMGFSDASATAHDLVVPVGVVFSYPTGASVPAGVTPGTYSTPSDYSYDYGSPAGAYGLAWWGVGQGPLPTTWLAWTPPAAANSHGLAAVVRLSPPS